VPPPWRERNLWREGVRVGREGGVPSSGGGRSTGETEGRSASEGEEMEREGALGQTKGEGEARAWEQRKP